MTTIVEWPHYKVLKLASIRDVLEMFAGKDADFTTNWIFLSTGGVHGDATTLDAIEDDDEPDPTITVLVVHPRLCALRYGDLPVRREDVPRLRELVAKTLAGIAESQRGNLPPAVTAGTPSAP